MLPAATATALFPEDLKFVFCCTDIFEIHDTVCSTKVMLFFCVWGGGVCVISMHSDDECEQNILYFQCFDINGDYVFHIFKSDKLTVPSLSEMTPNYSITSILKSTQLGFSHQAEVNVTQTQTATH